MVVEIGPALPAALRRVEPGDPGLAPPRTSRRGGPRAAPAARPTSTRPPSSRSSTATRRARLHDLPQRARHRRRVDRRAVLRPRRQRARARSAPPGRSSATPAITRHDARGAGRRGGRADHRGAPGHLVTAALTRARAAAVLPLRPRRPARPGRQGHRLGADADRGRPRGRRRPGAERAKAQARDAVRAWLADDVPPARSAGCGSTRQVDDGDLAALADDAPRRDRARRRAGPPGCERLEPWFGAGARGPTVPVVGLVEDAAGAARDRGDGRPPAPATRRHRRGRPAGRPADRTGGRPRPSTRSASRSWSTPPPPGCGAGRAHVDGLPRPRRVPRDDPGAARPRLPLADRDPPGPGAGRQRGADARAATRWPRPATCSPGSRPPARRHHRRRADA